MRFSIKGSLATPRNNSFPATASPHVTHRTCTCTLTQQVSCGSQQRHYSLKSRESLNMGPVWPASPDRLGKRWMEYQGIRDWAGLLDPLDDNLRAEILRYGCFVEAAYRAFDFDPSSPSYGSCKYPKKSLLEEADFPATGYRLTKNLRATSGIQLPRWASSRWPATLQASWIGYVAVCHDRAEIARLGRRDVVVALRGTATALEWLENLRATLTPVAGPPLDCNAEPMVESGFLSLYSSGSATSPSLRETVREEVGRILELYPDETLSFTFTGHSMGAALATLAAYDIKMTFAAQAPHVTVMSFGGPRVGDHSFRSLLEQQGTKILRIVNPTDVITKVPGFVMKDNHNGDDNNSNNNNNDQRIHPLTGLWPSWIQKWVEDTQCLVYAEIGCELRLQETEDHEVKLSQLPYYLSNMNLAKCHDLKTYLQLVQHFSSSCPLRATARGLFNKPCHQINQISTLWDFVVDGLRTAIYVCSFGIVE
ncbi:hypothetical protein Cgig2_033262 [Carnegiea gigantea]|uniref:Fungal lipase-type domain-containing protein n=1 Tax=Carnegiea gigantea TaxID=171969 RepID=A0A9Q1KV10_9CARY|nr:hypothetical protein Cgig2_033262 [Carnegiea gigantea]